METLKSLGDIVDFFRSREYIEAKRKKEAEEKAKSDKMAYLQNMLSSDAYQPVQEVLDDEIKRCYEILAIATLDEKMLEMQKVLPWYIQGLRYLKTLKNVNNKETA